MFGDQPLNFTLTAAVAVSRYHVVQASGAGYGGLATAKTQALVGIAQNEPAAGEAVTICPLGRSRAIAGGSVSLYARITSNTSGRVAACGSGDTAIGYALTNAGADGDNIEVMLVCGLDKTSS